MTSMLDSLNIDGSNIVWSDHPSGSKRRGVFFYFKESLPIRIFKITPITECLVLEMLFNKLVIKSSQEFAQFEILSSHLLNDITSKKLFFSIILDDFSASSKCSWSLDKQIKEGDSLFLIS